MEGEEGFGYPSVGAGAGAVDTESLVMPYLGAFAQFREDVRKVAKQQKGKGCSILKITKIEPYTWGVSKMRHMHVT